MDYRDGESNATTLDTSRIRIVGSGKTKSVYVFKNHEAVFVCENASESENLSVLIGLSEWWMKNKEGWWTNYDMLFRCKSLLN